MARQRKTFCLIEGSKTVIKDKVSTSLQVKNLVTEDDGRLGIRNAYWHEGDPVSQDFQGIELYIFVDKDGYFHQIRFSDSYALIDIKKAERLVKSLARIERRFESFLKDRIPSNKRPSIRNLMYAFAYAVEADKVSIQGPQPVILHPDHVYSFETLSKAVDRINDWFILKQGAANVNVEQYLNEMTSAYLEAATFFDADEEDEGDCEVSEKARKQAREDCQSFLEKNQYCTRYPASQIGHDFWLTRQGHGTGFWDRNEVYTAFHMSMLEDAAKDFNHCYLTLGDDQKYYFE